MNVKVSDLMVENVVTLEPGDTVGRARSLMEERHIGAIPVKDADGGVAGIVTTRDLTGSMEDETPITEVMTEGVYTIPQYNDVHHAARLMRNHKIHHVVVTHEQAIVGILSSFDLLKLVEEHRYVEKPAPGSKKNAPRRQ